MLTLKTPPTDLPITLADVKEHIGIEHTFFDNLLTNQIKAAVDLLETECNRSIMETTWEETFTSFPYAPYFGLTNPVAWEMSVGWEAPTFLTMSPLKSITSIKYYDQNNTLQTWDASNYYAQTPTNTKGYIIPLTYYPLTYWSVYARPDCVQITYKAGYDTIPERLKQAIRMIVNTMFDHRSDSEEKPQNSTLLGLDRLMDSVRTYTYV